MKRLLKRLIRILFEKNLRWKNNKIIKKKIENCRLNQTYTQFPTSECRPIITQYSFFRKSDLLYLDFFYSILNVADKNFISLPIYYNNIEPVLNDIVQLKSFKDKNIIDQFFEEANTPKTFLRKINGSFFDLNYFHIKDFDRHLSNLPIESDHLILKPSIESGAGQYIMKFNRKIDRYITDNGILLSRDLLNQFPDFVLQEAVIQNEFFQNFNKKSNNTVRILTYRSVESENVVVLHRLLRIGSPDSFLDHDDFGGIAVGIDEDSRLNNYGCSKEGIKYSVFNQISFKEIDSVPFILEMENTASNIAKRIFYGRVLAFDFTVDKSGQILLLEINAWRNGISQYQMNNESVFKSYTEEVLDYCANKAPKKSITI